MTIIGTQQQHIQELISDGVAHMFDKKISSDFAQYIERNYPLKPVTGYSIDWSNQEGCTRIMWSQVTDDEVEAFIYDTTLGQHSYTAVWYGRNQPGIICDLEFSAKNIDLLFASGGGVRYLFGARRLDSCQASFCFSDFVEVDGSIWISGFRKLS